jgi:endothelin-converting enzyme/putative endopeptidase
MKASGFLFAALPFLALSANAQTAQDHPLTALPYTPSLDVKAMDKSVDPCTNFYRYSCGSWIRNNPIPPDQARWDVYAKLQQDNQLFLWGLLEQAAKPSANRTLVEQEIGDYFESCMNEAAVEKAGLAALKPELDAIAALKSVKDLPALLAQLHLKISGDHMLFGFSSGQDYSDSSQVIAFASSGGLGLPDRDYYLKTDTKSQETRAKYLEHVQSMLELLGDSPQAAAMGAHTVMEMETALAKATLTRVEQRDPYKQFHKMRLEDLQAMTPAFAWAAYFSASGAPPIPAVNVTEPKFYHEMQSLLKGRTVAEWKTYLRWHYVHDKARYLSTPFVQADFAFYRQHLRGVKEMQPRWKRCVAYVDRDLGEALGKEFVEKTFTPETKARTLAMTKEIEAAMEKEIEQLPWMSDATKSKALEKLHTIVNKIGYPEKWRDYSSVKIARDDFLGDQDRATIFESHRDLAKIGKPVDRAEWQMTPPTVNAYYDSQLNDMNFPAGVLQPPLFDPKLDDAPNFGDTGATIGHELTHGFDDEGRKFDAKGNLHDWWTKQDAANFEKRSSCVVDQYAQYTVVDQIKINSKLTLGEDLADLGGTLIAYLAWKHATMGQTLQPIDGLTPDQRFFIGMAQWACGDERPENKRLNAATNEHSPDEYRVNGVVSDMPEFQKAFSCKAGQPMVRASSCRVW